MEQGNRLLINGNEAIAYAALDAGVNLGTGYPGTPSTEILETLGAIGGKAQWAPNEKVALEVAIGVAFADDAKAVATMKHVGLNVAADPLFTAAHTGVSGSLVLVVADDPGMASSQNEQDSRRYAIAAGLPMLEPADSQEAYDFMRDGLTLSKECGTPVLLRVTTRVCHSKSIVTRRPKSDATAVPSFTRDIPRRVMVPAYARPAHKRMRQRLADLATYSETCDFQTDFDGGKSVGIIASGIAAMHAREAAPEARLLKLGMTYPLPMDRLRAFAESVDRCVVIEEGDPVMLDACRAAGIDVEGKPEADRFGELTVTRVRRILDPAAPADPIPAKGKPPQLCPGCPHRRSFQILSDYGCFVTGDIGCYTLGVLAPFEAMDTCVCMGASIGVGLGLRHVLPEDRAKKVISVIGDSTFAHSGLTGLVEMIYNPPPTGHVVLILDNSTTAMTGLQDHPGTGRTLMYEPTNQLVFEDVARAMGIKNVTVINPQKDPEGLATLVVDSLESGELCVIIARSPCLLSGRKDRAREEARDNKTC